MAILTMVGYLVPRSNGSFKIFRLRPADAGRISQSGGLGKLTGLHNGRLRFEGKWRRSISSDERMLVGEGANS